MKLVQRNLAPWAREILAVSPILVIEGARQTGKSTLVTMLDGDASTYVTLDDEVTQDFARKDPVGLLRSAGQGRLVIDEVQRCPELILPLKMEVDQDRRAGRFILTGSANLLRIPGAEDSLAGRAMTLRLHPFSQGELAEHIDDWVSHVLSGAWRSPQGAGDSREERSRIVTRVTTGGYPPVQEMSARLRQSWITDYTNRLIERDSRDLGSAQVPALRRLMHLIAAAPGAELVLERLAESLGLTRATVGRYLELLESLFLLHRLPAWSRNLTSRQVKRSKCYPADPGLTTALSGLSAQQLLSPHGADHLGPLVEHFVVTELIRQQGWASTPYELFHLRDRNGAEVDVVIETPQGVIGVEVKAATTARPAHFKHLAELRDRIGSEFLAGIVLTLGDGQLAGDRLAAMPVSSLWGQAS
ncbi:MAG: ATP-binding protein [Propionibacteriaceae bacterium]|nr:ATP-binding protein [Propionibacteriaceae bacterium]